MNPRETPGNEQWHASWNNTERKIHARTLADRQPQGELVHRHPRCIVEHHRPHRVALYSHDALGLGHIRRNLSIAHALRTLTPSPDIMFLTSAPEAVMANRPQGCDMVCLPSVAKDDDGDYRSRFLSLSDRDVSRIRQDVLTAAVSAFEPDVLIVDKHPRGFRRELEPALSVLAQQGGRAVLGLRDIMDRPDITAEEWQRCRGRQAVDRWYSQVWVYGDPRVHNVLDELDLSADALSSCIHTGYLSRGRMGLSQDAPTTQPFVLATVGGGQDGVVMATAFAEAAYPPGHIGILITGSQMPDADRNRIEQLAEARCDLTVAITVDGVEGYIHRANAVVAMGGYNTVCEAIAHETPLLIVPRTHPRQEQLIRAQGLARLGQLDYVVADDKLTHNVEKWLAHAVNQPRTTSQEKVDLNGLRRVPYLIDQLIHTRTLGVTNVHPPHPHRLCPEDVSPVLGNVRGFRNPCPRGTRG